jgi:hypothetical protein
LITIIAGLAKLAVFIPFLPTGPLFNVIQRENSFRPVKKTAPAKKH